MADQTFELYKLLLEEVREVRRARRGVSTSFLTLNLAGVGALGVLAGLHAASERAEANVFLLVPCVIALILTCVIWMTSNTYYDKNIAAKFKTIYDVEDRLECPERPMKTEWAARERDKKGAARWFTIERAMPVIFIFGYIVFAIVVAKFDVATATSNLTEFVSSLVAQFGGN